MDFDQSMVSSTTGESQKKVVEDLIWLRNDCDKRCLFETALWAEECIVYQSEDIVDTVEFIFDEKSTTTSTMIEVKTRFIRNLILNKEYHRAVFHAEKLPEPLNPHHAFLLYFSKYMACLEKQAQECPDKPEYALNRDDVIAPQLCRKIQLLRFESEESFDCWMYYLLGLVFKMSHNEQKARDAFFEAIRLDYRCWPAWESLALIVKEKGEILTFDLPRTWQYKLFLAKASVHLNILRDAVDIYEDLVKTSLGSVPYLICENAAVVGALQEHGSAISMFQLVHKSDPYRIEQMNHYADSLFIHQESDELYVLGRFFEKSHKYTWQCCQILANYFALVKQHDRAHSLLITATRLSPRNSLLWVLLGHACVELKNPTDAVSAYRKAIAIDPDIFQPYYSMGQIYEIFGFPDFALRFYEQAHRCRPSDSRMLVAMGVGFAQLRRFKDAENAYIKAFRVGDVQGNALKKLGNLYEELKEPEKAAKVYTTFLRVYGEENHSDTQMFAHSCLYLAQYYYDQNKYDKANEYAERCINNEYTKESALKIQREIQMKNALALDEKNPV
uniref:Cdc23 domain-containing protein n=1 Tax=Panagrolaimus superbus TaxID=310955 RepID=A0A914Z410_9BILA